MEEVVKLPAQTSGETSFFNVLEWISFSKQEEHWTMERVRRIVSHGGKEGMLTMNNRMRIEDTITVVGVKRFCLSGCLVQLRQYFAILIVFL